MFDATGTIGSLPCEISLNKILADKNDAVLSSKIIKLLQKYKANLKSLQEISDIATRKYFASLVRKETEIYLSKIMKIPVRRVPVSDIVASHTMCCIAAYYRRNI